MTTLQKRILQIGGPLILAFMVALVSSSMGCQSGWNCRAAMTEAGAAARDVARLEAKPDRTPEEDAELERKLVTYSALGDFVTSWILCPLVESQQTEEPDAESATPPDPPILE